MKYQSTSPPLPFFEKPTTSMDAMFDASEPGVYALFEKLADQARSNGFKHCGEKTIVEEMRRHHEAGVFKVNNNFGALMARRYMREHPDLVDFFHLRESKHDGQE